MSQFPLFRAPAITHLDPGQIGGLSTAHNDTSDSLQGSLVSFQADAARATTRACGCGRVLSGDADADGAMVPQIGAGLTVRLVTGYEAIIQGQPFVVDDPSGFVVLAGAPASASSWLYLSLADGEPVAQWESAARPDLVAVGLPCVGLVTAGAESVSSIELSHETTIAPLYLLRDQMTALLQRVEVLESSGGGSAPGAGGVVYAGNAPWLPAPGDARDTATVIEAKRQEDRDAAHQALVDLEARLRDYIENGTDLREELTMQTSNEWLVESIVRVLSKLAEVNTHAPEWLEVAMVKFGVYGHAPDGAAPPAPGINDTPNFLLHTTLQIEDGGATP